MMLSFNIVDVVLLCLATMSAFAAFLYRGKSETLEEVNKDLREQVKKSQVESILMQGRVEDAKEREKIHKLTQEVERTAARYSSRADDAAKRQDLQTLSDDLNSAFSNP